MLTHYHRNLLIPFREGRYSQRMNNLVPEVRVNKNGVSVTKHVKAAVVTEDARRAIPAPVKEVQKKQTFAGTVRELESLGINLIGYKSKYFGVKLLAKNDPEMLREVMESITEADTPTRAVWQNTLGKMSEHTTYYNSLSYKRMIANNELTARLIENIDSILSPQYFQTDNLANHVEEELGIRPGDERYNEVQAAIIYCAVTSPHKVTRIASDLEFLSTHRDDIMTIANNMERAMEMLPELCRRRDASRHVINEMGTIDAPALIDGAL